jgi:uncharacterized membrane protein YkvA (DUF1232 family)
MSEVLSAMKFFGGCGTMLFLAFMGLLAMPKSRLRAVMMQIVGWAVVALCVAYGLSPIDLIPEAFLGPLGLVDDLGALAVAVGAGSAAMQAKREMKEL